MAKPMSRAFCKRWGEYGGMDVSMISQMKSLDDETRGRADACGPQHSDRSAQGGAGKKMTRPSQRQKMAVAVAPRGLGRAGLPGLWRQRAAPSLQAKRSKRDDRLVGRTNARKTWGGQSVFAVSAKRERAIRGSASASAALPRRRGSCPANGLSGSSQTRQIRSGRWISWLTGQASQLLNAADIAAPEGLGIEVDAS
jgi:hypothetical protein